MNVYCAVKNYFYCISLTEAPTEKKFKRQDLTFHSPVYARFLAFCGLVKPSQMIEALMIFAVENNWQPPPEILAKVMEARRRGGPEGGVMPRTGRGKKISGQTMGRGDR